MIFADKLAESDSILRELLANARKIRVHPDVYDTASMLIETDEKRIEKVAPYAVWPDYETWIEGRMDADNRGFEYGFLFYGGGKQKSVTAGYGCAVLQPDNAAEPIVISVFYDLATYTMTAKTPDTEVWAELNAMTPNDPRRYAYTEMLSQKHDPIQWQATAAPILKLFKPLLFALLALMNSPKLVRTREHDHSKLNARRIKRGKYPYYPHHEVVLNIDKHSFMVTKGQGDGPERSLHFVRSHLRFYVHPRYKNVEVAIVQPHWRGNPELGIRDTEYSMQRGKSKWNE